MVQFTSRDDEMLRWLAVLRLTDMETIRWAFGGLSGAGEPVVLRRRKCGPPASPNWD